MAGSMGSKKYQRKIKRLSGTTLTGRTTFTLCAARRQLSLLKKSTARCKVNNTNPFLQRNTLGYITWFPKASSQEYIQNLWVFCSCLILALDSTTLFSSSAQWVAAAFPLRLIIILKTSSATPNPGTSDRRILLAPSLLFHFWTRNAVYCISPLPA